MMPRVILFFAIGLLIISCKENPIETTRLQKKDVIVFSSNRSSANKNLFKMGLDGSNLRQLTFFTEGNYVASDISEDGEKILFYDSWSTEPDVGMGIYIYNVPENKVIGPIAYGTPGNFSPDNKKFVYTKHIWEEGIDSIWIFNLEDGTEKRITKPSTSCCQCCFSSDGELIAYGEVDPKSSNFFACIVLTDISGNVIKKITANTYAKYALHPKFLNKGNKLLFSFLSDEIKSYYDICLADINSPSIKVISNTQQRRMYDDLTAFFHPTTNSDDTKIIFNTQRTQQVSSFNPEIAIMNIDGSEHIRLTHDNYWDSNPVVGSLYFY